MSAKSTTEDFIRKAREVHGDKFDYSLVEYVRATDKVNIICPIHGVFEQTPNGHLSMGQGCPKCAREYIGSLKRKETLQKFENKIKEFGGDYQYEYPTNGDLHAHSYIKVVCPTHGESNKSVSDFYKSNTPCRKCSMDIITQSRTWTPEIFLEKARAKFGDKFKYHFSTEEPFNSYTRINIECKKHGITTNTIAQEVLRSKHGCNVCASEYSILPHTQHKYIEHPTIFYTFKYKGVYKIGVTIYDTKKRYSGDADTSLFEDIREFKFNTYNEAFMLEQYLIERYYQYRYFGERIFRSTGITECFTKDIVTLFLEEGGDIGS